jgi:uncharacterized protein
MMKHTLSAVMLVLVAVTLRSAPLLQVQAGPAGHWEGTLQTPGQALDFSVDLVTNAGKWDGTISIPAQNVKGLPLAEVVVKGSAISFAMKGVPGDPRFTGTISKDGGALSGDFAQGGVSMPFTLAWKGQAKIDPPAKSTSITKEIEGSWNGSLDTGGAVLTLVFKLANQGGGATGTVVSVDQGGAEIPIASITQAASHLELVLSAISGRFAGDLKDGQIVGTWTQGGRSFPLVLKRSTK